MRQARPPSLAGSAPVEDQNVLLRIEGGGYHRQGDGPGGHTASTREPARSRRGPNRLTNLGTLPQVAGPLRATRSAATGRRAWVG